ncbi:hypothetical protein GEMRC1_014132 [Eukaryota sp. GEM-RC1]
MTWNNDISLIPPPPKSSSFELLHFDSEDSTPEFNVIDDDSFESDNEFEIQSGKHYHTLFNTFDKLLHNEHVDPNDMSSSVHTALSTLVEQFQSAPHLRISGSEPYSTDDPSPIDPLSSDDVIESHTDDVSVGSHSASLDCLALAQNFERNRTIHHTTLRSHLFVLLRPLVKKLLASRIDKELQRRSLSSRSGVTSAPNNQVNSITLNPNMVNCPPSTPLLMRNKSEILTSARTLQSAIPRTKSSFKPLSDSFFKTPSKTRSISDSFPLSLPPLLDKKRRPFRQLGHTPSLSIDGHQVKFKSLL